MLKGLTSILILLLPCLMMAQNPVTLEEAIQIARENSLRMKQSQLGVARSEIELSQAKQQRLPNFNMSSGYSYNLGRSVNPITYQFETNEFSYTNIGANSGVTLFNGGRINNSVQRAKIALHAAQEDLYQEADNIALDVALAYLNVLFAEENRANAEAQLAASEVQLDRIVKSIDAGATPVNERYDLDAQVAMRRQNVTQQENAVRMAYLSLRQIMLLDPEETIVIDRPNIDAVIASVPGTLAPDVIFEQALAFRHDVIAARLYSEAALKDVQIAKAGYWPSLSLGLNSNSGFTDLAREPAGFSNERITIPGVFIDGEAVNYQVTQLVPTGLQKVGVVDQLNRNLSIGVSVNLSIPIYNRRNVRSNVEISRIQHEQSLINELSTKQVLRQNIEQAVADFKASRDNLEAQQQTVNALEAAFSAAERRYAVGQGNTFDLTNAKNQLDGALNQLTIARYDYVFKLKVIDFYLGRGLSL
jgi:outer membrane protein